MSNYRKSMPIAMVDKFINQVIRKYGFTVRKDQSIFPTAKAIFNGIRKKYKDRFEIDETDLVYIDHVLKEKAELILKAWKKS